MTLLVRSFTPALRLPTLALFYIYIVDTSFILHFGPNQGRIRDHPTWTSKNSTVLKYSDPCLDQSY